MYLLAKEHYSTAAISLAQVNFNHLFAKSVLESHVGGHVFGDDPLNPKAFYVIHPYGMSLLYGKISDTFLRLQLKKYMLGQSNLRDGDEFLQICPIILEKRIDAMLGNHLCIHTDQEEHELTEFAVVKHQRVNFKFDYRKHQQYVGGLAMDKYHLQRVERDIFESTEGSVVPKHFWGNGDDFIRNGKGFAILQEGECVSIAFSSFINEGMLELGMETATTHRRKGLAGIVCAKLIEYCLANGIEPVWSCRAGNSASFNLAVKLGFVPSAYLPYYELRKQY